MKQAPEIQATADWIFVMQKEEVRTVILARASSATQEQVLADGASQPRRLRVMRCQWRI